MENVLISACLLGVACRYDGCRKPLSADIIAQLQAKYHLIPVCPEIFGGLSTPRIPAEIQPDRRVLRSDGVDITENYRKGAEESLRLAYLFHCRLAFLKEKSPSCGSGKIYDGSFSKTLTDGDGITARLLQKNGIRIIGESEIPKELFQTKRNK
ncbi:MAG: DUF523 domain-containing protein [Clostridia bacterium]|nr:DUF523 domain-containing protein [Clostridia bacterium]